MHNVRSIVLTGLLMGMAGSPVFELPALAQTKVDRSVAFSQEKLQSMDQTAIFLASNPEMMQSFNKALASLKQGNYRAVIENYKPILNANPKTIDPTLYYFALTGTGLAHGMLQEFSQSIDYFEKALAIVPQLKDPQLKGQTLLQLSTPHIAMGNHAKGLEYSDQSLAIARATRDRSSELASLLFIGNTYNKLGSAKKALDYYQQGLPIAQELNDRRQLALLIGYRGGAQRSLGNYPQALTDLQQAGWFHCRYKKMRMD